MSSKSIDMECVVRMKRRELQQLCKQYGIKGNLKNSELISRLQKLATSSPSCGKYSSPRKQQNLNTSNPLVENKPSVQCTPDITARQVAILNGNTGDDFTDKLMKEINQKAMTPLLKPQPTANNNKNEMCKIPRLKPMLFSAAGVIVSDTNPPKNQLHTDFTAKHRHQFDKFDSIDVYLEKKRKRTERLRQSTAIAKKVVTNSKLAMIKMKKEHSTPKALKTKRVVIVDPSPLRPVMSTPMRNNTTLVLNTSRSNKFKFGETSICAKPDFGNTSTTKGKPAFDLQASLKKRLSYKPYKGKIPMATKENEPVTKRADVKISNLKTKNITCIRGEQRRQTTRNRKEVKQNAINTRRGIA